MLWTDRPCKNFHLIICLAVLDTEKSTLIENKFGFTEILKVCINELIKLPETTILIPVSQLLNQLQDDV